MLLKGLQNVQKGKQGKDESEIAVAGTFSAAET